MLAADFVQYNLRPPVKQGRQFPGPTENSSYIQKTVSNPGLLRRPGSGNFPRFTERVASPFCCLIETAPQ
jgi:hypothetical protein